jgi:hypothetical protein
VNEAISRSCAGKVSHATKADALRVLKRRVRGMKGCKANAYRCPNCGAWHVGNAPARFIGKPKGGAA